MEDGNRTDAASTSKTQAASIHLQSTASTPANTSVCHPASDSDCFTKSCLLGLKNEDAYEIAIPYEENSFEQQGFFTQSDQSFDGES